MAHKKKTKRGVRSNTMTSTSNITPKMTQEPKKKKIKLKSRFTPMIKTSNSPEKNISTTKTFEGNVYYEFEGFEGVFFNGKMFIE